MRKKLQRFGNSYAVVLDRPLLERIGIDPSTGEDEVEIVASEDDIAIRWPG